MKMQRDDEIAAKFRVTAAVGFLLLATVSEAVRAEDTPSAGETRIDTVEPAVFGAGATVVLKGQGFDAADTVFLGALKLEALEVKPTAIRAKVPDKAKNGAMLTVKRGKKKATSSKAFTFAKSPILRKTVPIFGVPGGSIKVLGANLDTVDKVKVGDTAIKVESAQKTSLTFTVPANLTTGTLSVSGPGGTATLKKPLEVFYPPVIEKLDPGAVFPGDTVTVSGKHLGTKGIRFFIGKKPVKVKEAGAFQVKLVVPPNAASDPVKAAARKITAESETKLIVHPIPTLIPSPPAVGSPGTLTVRGKHLDAVVKWTIDGHVLAVVAGFAKRSAKLLQLKIPGDMNTEGNLTATVKGREFAAKKPTKVFAAPHIGAVRFAKGASGTDCEYTVVGRNLGKGTAFKLGKKKLKVVSATEKRAVLTLKGDCAAAGSDVSAQNGKFKGNDYAFNPNAEGYTATPEESTARLAAGKTDYTPEQIESDLALMEDRFKGTKEAFAAEGQAAGKDAAVRAKIDRLSGDVGVALVRLAEAEASLCAAMAPGRNNAQANEALGAVLDKVTAKEKHLMNNVLIPLWSKLPKAALTKGVRLDTVDADVLLIDESKQKHKPCVGKFYGKKLVAEAEKTAAVNLGALHEQAVTGALSNLSGKTANAVIEEKELNDALYSFTAQRRAYWVDKAKKASSKVQKSDRKTVGKGAGKNKKIKKSSKQKAQGNTGKGK